jgi:O-glycosyl hydrolase
MYTIYKQIGRLLIVIISYSMAISCQKDNFEDPNDPKYDSKYTGISLNFNNTFQTIDHFGASGGFQNQWIGKWPEASKAPIAKLLFSTQSDAQGNPEGIGLSMWRTVIGDGTADQANSGFAATSWYRKTECYLNNTGVYNWTKQSGEEWFLVKAREYGVNKFTGWASSPPYFMTKNGYAFKTSNQTNGFNCAESNYVAYATFLADVMKNYENKGYNFDVVCPFNETQYDWSFEVGQASQSGTQALNSEVAAVTRIIDQKFTEKGVRSKIMIPEAAQLKYLYEGTGNTVNQVNDFFNSSSSNYVGNLSHISKHVAGHSYFSNNTVDESLNQRKSLRLKLASLGNGLDYWQTEYSLLGTEYLQGKDPSALKEIDYALWLCRIIHTDLVHGNATGWSFWTALSQSTFGDHPFRFNFILYQPNANSPSQTDGTFYTVKNLWAFGNYSRFVRPGMVRFEVLDPEYTDNTAAENFMISGYINQTSKEIVLVCVNNTDKSRAISFQNYSKDFEVVGGLFEMYTTSTTTNLKKSSVAFNAVSIPSKSIVTLKAKLK